VAGLPAGFHFHDLRHTGNDLATRSGASTRELMHGIGHTSMAAALIYQRHLQSVTGAMWYGIALEHDLRRFWRHDQSLRSVGAPARLVFFIDT
jgi:hypothetical protein